MKLPTSVRKLARIATGMRRSEAISPRELAAIAAREDVLVLALGPIDDRLPGDQRQTAFADLAAICAGVSRQRLIVTHCG